MLYSRPSLQALVLGGVEDCHHLLGHRVAAVQQHAAVGEHASVIVGGA